MEKAITSVRRFNRFFTQFVGALDNNFLDSGMTLVEARILFEVANADTQFADEIQRSLHLDAGFVSRSCGDLKAANGFAGPGSMTMAGAARFASLP